MKEFKVREAGFELRADKIVVLKTVVGRCGVGCVAWADEFARFGRCEESAAGGFWG